MRVKVTVELDLPDEKWEESVKRDDEYVKGITWEMAFVIQAVFDNLLNFAIGKHRQMALQWMGKNKEMPHAELIVKQHNTWADILQKAEPTMKIEKIV